MGLFVLLLLLVAPGLAPAEDDVPVDLGRLGEASYVFGPACAEGLAAWCDELRAQGYSPDRYGNDMAAGYVDARRPDYVDAGLQAFLREFYGARIEAARAAAEQASAASSDEASSSGGNVPSSAAERDGAPGGDDGTAGGANDVDDGGEDGDSEGSDEGAAVDVFDVSSVAPVAVGSGYRGFPVPEGNTGRGVHFVPNCWPTEAMIRRWVPELARLGMQWSTILNPGSETSVNQGLVKAMRDAGVMPIMRVMQAPGAPITPEKMQALVSAYRPLGVHYYEIFNEPNVPVEWSGSMPALQEAARTTAENWLPLAKAVFSAGGRPAIPSLSPAAEENPPDKLGHRAFLKIFLETLRDAGPSGELLDATWISVHNYSSDTGAAKAGDPEADGDWILRLGEETRSAVSAALSKDMPVIGTEGGFQANADDRGPWQETMRAAYVGLYRYMAEKRPDWFLATCPWILANKVAGGKDDAWEKAAWFSEYGDWDFVEDLAR